MYNKLNKCFDYQDKYAGRKLQCQASFQHALYQFLFDGTRLLTELIPDFISKLYQLYDIIQGLNGYRFYGSSLFIVYDAENPLKLDFRLIDFAQCVTRQELLLNMNHMTCPPHSPLDPDHGYLKGLQSIIYTLENLYKLALKSQ